MSIGERIKAARERMGLSQAGLAYKVGVSQPTVAAWEKVGAHKVNRSNLLRLASVLNVDPQWISFGTGRGIEEPLEDARPDGGANPRGGSADIPEVDAHTGAGLAADAPTVDVPAGAYSQSGHETVGIWSMPLDYLRHELRVPKLAVRLVEVIGDSMHPTLQPGDRIMVNTGDRKPSPPGIFALWDGLGVVVKRVEHIPNTDPLVYRIGSDNPHHATYERTEDEVHIIGRVVWYGRRI